MRRAIAEDNHVETGGERHRRVAMYCHLLHQEARGRVNTYRGFLRGADAERTAVSPYGRLIYKRIGVCTRELQRDVLHYATNQVFIFAIRVRCACDFSDHAAINHPLGNDLHRLTRVLQTEGEILLRPHGVLPQLGRKHRDTLYTRDEHRAFNDGNRTLTYIEAIRLIPTPSGGGDCISQSLSEHGIKIPIDFSIYSSIKFTIKGAIATFITVCSIGGTHAIAGSPFLYRSG